MVTGTKNKAGAGTAKDKPNAKPGDERTCKCGHEFPKRVSGNVRCPECMRRHSLEPAEHP